MADEFLESLGLNGMAEGGGAPPEDHTPDSEPAPEAAPAPEPEPETKPEPPENGGGQPDPEETRTPGKSEAERLRELQAENARLVKRQRDTQSAYTKAHQRLKQLEKGGKPDPATPPEEPGDWFGEDSPEAGSDAEEQPPEEAAPPEEPEPAKPEAEADPELKRKVDQLSAQQEELRKAEAMREWNAAEERFRSTCPDYDSVVGKELDDAINAGDELSGYLMSKYKKLGATPEAAYKVGQELRRMRGETSAPAPEPKTKTPASRQDDPDWNSMPPEEGGGESGSGSPLDEFLEGK